MAFEDHTDRDHLPEFRFQERRIWQQADMEEVSLMNVHLNLKMEDYYRIKDAQIEQDKK